MSARLLLTATDPSAVARSMGQFELTIAGRDLRKLKPPPEEFSAVARSIAEVLLENFYWHEKARAVALALLLDIGERERVAIMIVDRLGRDDVGVGDLFTAGRILNLLARRNSGRWVLNLAEEWNNGGQPVTRETCLQIIERLRTARQPWEDVDTDQIPDPDLASLEEPVIVPGLGATVIRPVRSRGQCDRYAHHLRNCASSYVTMVKSGACRLLGVEVDGTPVELIEVNPRNGRVVQWKGHLNSAPEPRRRRVLERFLTEHRLAVVR